MFVTIASDNGMGNTENTRRVLVVDDEQDIVEVLSYLLKRAGYEVVSALNGRTAVDAVRAGGIDLVLLDYMLPDINGLDVLRQAKVITPGLKVIIVTGRAADRVLAELMDAGASAIVMKPFINDKLMKLVRDTLAS